MIDKVNDETSDRLLDSHLNKDIGRSLNKVKYEDFGLLNDMVIDPLNDWVACVNPCLHTVPVPFY